MARQPACRLILGLGGYGLDKPVLWTGRGSQVSTILGSGKDVGENVTLVLIFCAETAHTCQFSEQLANRS
jgi:hypothetical protein